MNPPRILYHENKRGRYAVVRVEHEGKPYLFGNTVFHALHFDKPHLITQNLPHDEKILIPGLYGTFISKETVQKYENVSSTEDYEETWTYLMNLFKPIP